MNKIADELFGVLGFEHHHTRNPWFLAPPWAIELRILLEPIHKDLRKIMAKEDDLNNAVSALATGYTVLHDAVTVELKVVADALSKSGVSDAVVTAAIANINSFTTKMAADAAALTASVPAATTIAPPPAQNPVVPDAPTVAAPSIAPVTVTDPAAQPPTSGTGTGGATIDPSAQPQPGDGNAIKADTSGQATQADPKSPTFT